MIMIVPTERIRMLNASFSTLDFVQGLHALCEAQGGKIVFSSSLGPEDQVITDAIFRNRLPIEIFTLDTGRLFSETYDVLDETLKKYQQPIKVYYPEQEALQKFVSTQGINAFYKDINARKNCCQIRKIEPLNRALEGADIWITGIRSEQSTYRSGMEFFEWDADRKLSKYNPLLDWSTEEVWHYINAQEVPYNVLHKKGFPSIGCQPCTRAIGLHENERSGRWWWEETDKKECGLHCGQSIVHG